MSTREKPGWRTVADRISSYGYLFVIAAFLLLDFIPRFLQGDSISYLKTGESWIPPDRSWAFGYFVNYLFRHTHGGTAFILMQVAILALIIAASRIYFTEGGKAGILYGVCAVVVALDPCFEIYTRFFMSDLLAFAFFYLALLGLFFALREQEEKRPIWWWTAVVIVASMGAVWVRVAYAVILEATLALFVVIRLGRLSRRQWSVILLCVLGPVLALGSIMMANRVVFAERFPHELFVNKLSGVFAAAVFAPALQKQDFAAVGIPITDDEFQRLDLHNYGKRSAQVWGTAPDDLQQFLKDKLGITEPYTQVIDKAASGLVRSAFRRNPFALLEVYFRGSLEYATRKEWRAMRLNEMGLPRPLPDSFVSFWNTYSVFKIDPDITQVRSLLVRYFVATVSLYPFQLLLGLMAAAYLVIRERARIGVALLAAGFVADLAAAPLYSDFVIPRYVLGAIVISYLLMGLAVQSIVSRRFRNGDEAESRG